MNALVSQPLCSGFGHAGLRIVEASNTVEFKSFSDLTRKQYEDSPELQEMRNYDELSYLARYGGLPGFVKGVSSYANGMKVFTPDFKFFTRLCSSRVVENKIKFNYGSEQVLFSRNDCWEYAVKRERADLLIERRRDNAQVLPFEILREGDTRCPICLDELTGNVVNCPNNHQIDLACYELLTPHGGVKKCPTCRSPYSDAMRERVAVMNGVVRDSSGVLTFGMMGGNSSKAFYKNEALLLGMLRYASGSYAMEPDEKMLISAFYNWYARHHERFSSYNFNMLTQEDTAQGLMWILRPNIEHNNAFTDFIEDIHAPSIFEDVALTVHSMYSYPEERFNEDLEVIEGANSWRRNKEYPGSKKEFLKREIYFRTFTRVNDRDNIIKRFEKIIQKMMDASNVNNMPLINRQVLVMP